MLKIILKPKAIILTTFALFILITNIPLYSQIDVNIVEIRKQELKSEGIDTFIVYYKTYCHVSIKEDDNQGCLNNLHDNFPKTIYWVKNGVYFRQIINCKKNTCIEYYNSKFLKTVLKNIDKIKNTEIKPVQYYNSDKNKGFSMATRISETTITKFEFAFGNITFSKIINHFNLTTKSIEKKHRNVNYKDNQKSILNKIIRLVEKEE
jgi:hypothetical protein